LIKIIIGITGGIASGKSTVANFFRQKNVPVIDADTIGHRILERSHIIQKLIQAFGDDILHDGVVVRKLLGKMVFEEKENLHTLNAIVHPELIAEILKKIEEMDTSYIVIDAALLFKWNMDEICDYVLLVDAQEEIRARRLQKYKGLSFQDAMERIYAQESFSKDADFIIENNGTVEELMEKLTFIWEQIVQ